jgi:multiple sugar transport system permease protein
MPHIAVVGRRAPQTRLLIAAIYIILSLGAVTMVVPFWLMVSSSFTSNVDSKDFTLIPAYFYNDEALFMKQQESAFNEDTQLYAACSGEELGDFLEVKKPANLNQTRIDDYTAWKDALPIEYTFINHAYSVAKPKISLHGALLYRRFLEKRYDNDIKALAKAYGEDKEYFDLQPRQEEWHKRYFQPLRDLRFKEQMEFKAALPTRFRTPAPVEGTFRDFLQNQEYGPGVQANQPETYARRYKMPIKAMADLHLPERQPSQPKLAQDWITFVRTEIPYQYVLFDAAAQPHFTAWLKTRYQNDLAYLRTAYRDAGETQAIRDWADVKLVPVYPWQGIRASDWGQFLEDPQACPANLIHLDTPEVRYRNWCRAKYGTIQSLNKAYDTSYRDYEAVALPVNEASWSYMLRDKHAIKSDFLVRNYRDVIQYISVHGRALRNTLILVLAVVALTLTINPLSAYALSRYNLPQTYKILLFFLATMAFPAEVTAIPNFLLMKDLHMLNTFWALILPGAANGFSIFLLKGFFDGLPKELYEAAELDGASETEMFTKICLPMSTPVLAVIGLGAFNMAYGSFLWAFVVCQDKNMWTLMVWLQQMGSWAPQSMVYAALVLSAIPTLLVFVFAQDIIMRGIIIPMEK